MRKTLSLLLAMVMLISIASVSLAVAAEPVEVLFWHAMGGDAGIAIEALATKYNETVGAENGYVVTPLYSGSYAESSVKMNALIQANQQSEMPDLYQISAPGSFEVVNNEYLIPLYTLMQDGDFASITPQSIAYSSYQGKLYFFPYANSTCLMFYNKTMMNEAGITDYPKTMADLADLCEKLMVKTGDKIERYGFGTQMRTYLLGTLVPMQGEGLYMVDNENGHAGTPTGMIMDKDGTLGHVLDEWAKVLATGGAAYNDLKCQDGLVSGLYASCAASSGNLASLTTNMATAGYELGVTALVRVDENCSNGSALGGSSFAVFNSGREGAAAGAYDFLKFLYDADNCAYWSANTGYFPVNTEAWDAEALKNLVAENPNYLALKQAQFDSYDCVNYTEFWSPAYNEINTIITNECIAFGDGQSKEDTITRMADQVNELIQDWWDQN